MKNVFSKDATPPLTLYTHGSLLFLPFRTVKWFDTVKGFGFIVPADGSNDVFVHQSAIKMEGFRSLADGEEVEYMIDVDPKTGKRKAVQVTGPDGADVKGAPFRPVNDYNNY